MQTYQIQIHERNYTQWSLYDLSNNIINNDTDLHEKMNPLVNKIFDGDIISYSEADSKIVKSSGLTGTTVLPGVLILEGSKTFGRTPNNKRLYYRCIPDNKSYPVFLVPYDVKLGFSKHQLNKYILFKYDNWDGKHPMGELTEVLGDVSRLDVFYEYQLYCNRLHTSIKKLTNETISIIKQHGDHNIIQRIIENPNYQIEDRTNEYVFSIDPHGSKDFDDAFSIEKYENGYKVSVYIANVYIWMEELGLWDNLTERVSTIYLPDNKRPMLPTILSDSLCSLQEGVLRIALSMDIYLDTNGIQMENKEIGYKNAVIKSRKNYVYEERKLLQNGNYKDLMTITKVLQPTIQDSHDLVEYWMVRMNKEVGASLKTKEVGIFRNAVYKTHMPNNVYSHLDDTVGRMIRSWNNTDCKYVSFDKDISLRHDMMDVSEYVHITSPIRRMVDILNQIILSTSERLVLNQSKNAMTFLNKWVTNLDVLNRDMKTIRKTQSACQLLERCTNNVELLDKIHECVLFGKTNQSNNTYSYMVYLTSEKILTRIKTSNDYIDLSNHTCKLFMFSDEDNIKNKIKCVIQEQMLDMNPT